MSERGLTVLDGHHLRKVDLSLPGTDGTFTGSQILDIAYSRTFSSLLGLPLPESLKASALAHIGIENVSAFQLQEFSRPKASDKLRDYVTAIADQLEDDPLVVSVLDGSTIRLFLEDEDDFAMLSENLFTDLDAEDKGKIGKIEIRNALVNMGVEMGVPPFSEFPQLNDMLSKHGVEGDEELGQAQFAQLLQAVLQELAEALEEKHVVFIQNFKVTNGSKLRKLLANVKEFNDIIQKILQEIQSAKDGFGSTEVIRSFLEKNAKDLGLPPSEADEAVLLYDEFLADIGNDNVKLEKDELAKLMKQILENFAEQLECNPIILDHLVG